MSNDNDALENEASLAYQIVRGSNGRRQYSAVSAAHPHDEATKGKDSIEWVALWGFPQIREEQLERMLTTELQRKTLFALQEKQYLKAGKEHAYSIVPFQVANMRTVDSGFYVLDVIASVHKVINNEVDKKVEKYQITFCRSYDLGFVVMNVEKINHPKLLN